MLLPLKTYKNMKNRINNTFLHKVLGTGLCFIILFGMNIETVTAQGEGDSTDGAVRQIVKSRKKGKEYETKTVQGTITDDATGEAMGGVRIQALGLEQYSTLTEEDGTYKLDIPTFSDAVYARCDGKVSLSKMTFTHQMVRAVFTEQLYRAFTIIKGEPYHHE